LEDQVLQIRDRPKKELTPVTAKNSYQTTSVKSNETTEKVESNETNSNVAKTIYVSASAYVSFCSEGCSGVTATGVNVQNSITYKGKNIIAVDPSVIPLNSLVKVYPKDRPPFFAYAMDTGGGIKGNKIDFLISTNNTSEAIAFGRQSDVKVEIF
jgi:3D (Asp-Asp-Asp) domain-containing protein